MPVAAAGPPTGAASRPGAARAAARPASRVVRGAGAPTAMGAEVSANDPLAFARYLDVILLVLAAPFVLLTGLPALGYLVALAAWVLSRVAGALVERLARTRGDVRAVVGLNLGALLARTWLVGLTILAVGLAGTRQDGLMAAVTLLVAFTVYFALSLVLRPLDRRPPRQ